MLVKDVVYGLAGEYKGSQVACMEVFSKAEGINPDLKNGEFGYLFILEKLEIKQERIFMLWDGVCRRNTGKMIAILCAYLEILADVSKESINFAIDNNGQGTDLKRVVDAVKERFPNFNSDYHDYHTNQ